MASLRKKHSPDVVIAPVDDPVAVAVAVDAPKVAPAAEPIAPQDEAAKALKRQLDALNQATYSQQAAMAMQAAQERRQAWVQSNPLAQAHYDRLNAFHHEAVQSGLADGSPAYFDFLNSRLATLQAQHPPNAGKPLIEEMQARAAQDHPQAPPQSKPASVSYSAPVSREVPSANGQRPPGKITLTAEDREFAKIAGVSEAEYARQKQRLLEMKANGEIQ